MLLGAVMAIFSPRFADTAVSVSANAAPAHRGSRAAPFRTGSRQQALRWKEFVLLRRDPWLVSQTLMQLLYLVPPALMLWRSFADSSAAIVLITPVIVMAAGQLAGGLAWLTISGEDAADLVATAPLPPSRVTRAKIEVVLIAIGVMFAPLVAALAFASPLQAAVTALGVVTAAASATAIQLWFRVQARRSQFRRRQTSSRLATFAEAFSSIGWAATAALALAIPVAAGITGLMTAASWRRPGRSARGGGDHKRPSFTCCQRQRVPEGCSQRGIVEDAPCRHAMLAVLVKRFASAASTHRRSRNNKSAAIRASDNRQAIPAARLAGARDRSGIGGDAGDTAFGQPIVDIGPEPAHVPRFARDRHSEPLTQVAEKAIGHALVEHEFRRQLHQQDAELVAKSGHFRRKTIEQRTAIAQSLFMRDRLRDLDREAKADGRADCAQRS